jgi:glycosyltransferase involved in cell wall biosynthesis
MSSKSIVLISYVFPPDGAIGAVRVGKFAQGLVRDHGWSARVVVPRASLAEAQKNTETNGTDISITKTREIDMLRQVNSLRSIARRQKKQQQSSDVKQSEPEAPVAMPAKATGQRGALARLSDLIAVPDIHSGWIYFAFREAVRCVKRAGRDAVLFSSGPPHSAHVAAAMAKRRTGRRWVADLRDPWTDNPYNQPLALLAERWNKRLERRVLESADAILCTTEPARERLVSQLSHVSPDRIITVPNGYDPEDFAGIEPKARWPQDRRPVLVHAGSVYGRRDPTAFLQALAARFAEAPHNSPKAVFLGNWDANLLSRARAIAEQSGDPELVTMLPSVSRRESLEIQAAADWLVLLGDSMPDMLQIPGKLFEYLAMNKPILSLFPQGSPVGPYLQNYSPLHASASPDDRESILAALRTVDKDATRLSSPVCSISDLARDRQIERVQGVLETLIRPRQQQSAALRKSEAAAVAG